MPGGGRGRGRRELEHGGSRRELELEHGGGGCSTCERELERGVGERDACERCTSERGSSGGGRGTGELERGACGRGAGGHGISERGVGGRSTGSREVEFPVLTSDQNCSVCSGFGRYSCPGTGSLFYARLAYAHMCRCEL